MYGVNRRNIVIDSDWVWGWLADLIRGCTNFVNNSRPYKFEQEKKGFVIRNYANLKAQCYFKLKEMMEKRLIRVYADWVIRDKLSEELENIFITGIDTDWKVKIEDKKDLKRRINRSPDFADAIMFRMTLGATTERREISSSVKNLSLTLMIPFMPTFWEG